MSIQEHLNKIRNAIYGREVRESIAKGIETAYDDASENDNANMEVKIARGANPNLNTRLNKTDTEIDNLHLLKAGYSDIEAVADEIQNIIVQSGDGTKDTELINSRTDVTGKSSPTLKERLDKSQYRDMLLTKSIEGTKQSILFNDDGTVQRVRHYNSNDEIVRSDSFIYDGNKIIEERRLHGGEASTFIYDLDTLETIELNQEPAQDLLVEPFDSFDGQEGWILNTAYTESDNLVFEGGAVSVAYLSDNFKANSKYGLLFEIVENSLIDKLRIPANFTPNYENLVFAGDTGAFSYTMTTQSAPDRLNLATTTSETGTIKITNIRLFELPAYSQIKRDFETLTSSELNEKYPKEMS